MRRPAAPFAAAAAAYLACAAALHAGALLSLGRQAAAGSRAGAVFVWEFWWRAGGWKSFGGQDPGFTTALFHPVGTPLFPHAPLAVALGSAMSRFMPPATAQVLLHAAAFASAGCAMWLLAWRLTRAPHAAFLAGWVFMASSYSMTQQMLGHLGECFIAGLPLALLGAVELSQGSLRVGSAALCGGLLLSAAATPYVSLSTAAAVVAAGAFLLPSDRGRRLAVLGSCALAVGASALMYFPLAASLPQLRGGSDRYPLLLSSLATLPSWHPWAAVRAGAMPENMMGWVGLGALGAAAFGVWRAGSAARPWLAVAAVGAAFSLDAIPYSLLSQVPFVSAMRAPSRFMLAASAGVAALAAIGTAAAAPAGRRGWALAAVLAVLHAAEMLPGWPAGARPVDGGPLYRALAQDPAPGALLELPAGVTREGDLSVNSQEPMLRQTVHGRPLTLGRPPRHLAGALRVVESTDLLYELTHPAVIEGLYSAPALAGRLEALRHSGAAALSGVDVRFVVLRRNDGVFPEGLTRDTERLLRDALGAPWRDAGDAAAWRLP